MCSATRSRRWCRRSCGTRRRSRTRKGRSWTTSPSGRFPCRCRCAPA
jgi:hypothetical protein